MKQLLLPAAIVFGALYFGSLPVRADVIYTLNTSNDTTVKTGSGAGGPGPYAQVEIHLIDATHATAMFSGLNSFVFGEMGLDINASSFGISGLSFTLAPGVTKTPDYTIDLGGKVGSVGNFALDYLSSPNGASDAVSSASFTILNKSGTWASDTNVLIERTVPAATLASFWTNGNSFFASGGPSVSSARPCGPGTTGAPVPEPVSMAVLLGVGMAGCTLGYVRRRRSI